MSCDMHKSTIKLAMQTRASQLADWYCRGFLALHIRDTTHGSLLPRLNRCGTFLSLSAFRGNGMPIDGPVGFRA